MKRKAPNWLLQLIKIIRHKAAIPTLTGISGMAGTAIMVNSLEKPPKPLLWMISDTWLFWSILAFYVSSLALLVVSIWQSTIRDRVILETKSMMSVRLIPVVKGAHNVVRSASETAATRMKERTLFALSNLLALKESRFCLYLLESTEKDQPDPKGEEKDAVDSLEWDDDPPTGSTRPPRKQSYQRGSGPVADANFTVIDTLKPRLVSDWYKEAKNGNAHELDCEGGGYGGFLVVPVVAGREVKGILTVDVPEPGLLSRHHVAIAELAGQLLGVALQRLKRRGASSIPDNPL